MRVRDDSGGRAAPSRSRGGRGGTEQPVRGVRSLLPVSGQPRSFAGGGVRYDGHANTVRGDGPVVKPSICGGKWRGPRYDVALWWPLTSAACSLPSCLPSEQGQQARSTSVRPRERPMDRARSTNSVRSCPSTSASATSRLGRACDEVYSDPATIDPVFLSLHARGNTTGLAPGPARVPDYSLWIGVSVRTAARTSPTSLANADPYGNSRSVATVQSHLRYRPWLCSKNRATYRRYAST
jgi:hypothetical protein